MLKWNYESGLEKSTGYEEVIDTLKSYTKEKYEKANEEDKLKMVEEVFDIYRSINIFPIYYYNEEGIRKEIKKCVDKPVSFEGDVLNLRFNQGSSLCKFLFPNLNDVECKGAKNNSMLKRFYNDHKLKRAIELSLRIKKSVTPSEVRTALELIGGNVATNFKAMNAKALYEKYCPSNGVIYDFACGFGGRMLGALTSKNNYSYVGVEPCVETFNNLLSLGTYIEKTTNREDIFRINCIGSEDYKLPKESVDFAFSSPPYFNLEQYSQEDTQCYNRYKDLEEWFEKYVRLTIRNIYHGLKKERYYAVNIADYKDGKDLVGLVDKWIEISKEEGFEFIEQIYMKLQSRRGEGHRKENGTHKKEGIFVFKK